MNATEYARLYIDTIVPGVDYEARTDTGLLANIRTLVIEDCRGPNKYCRKAHREGRTLHVVPPQIASEGALLVLPTVHFTTIQEAANAIAETWYDAPTVHTYAERDEAYARGEAIWIARDIH